MNFIPEEKIKPNLSINLAPMIDFLFLMLAFFATLAISRATIVDSRVDLVNVKEQKSNHITSNQNNNSQVNLSVSNKGDYKWITEINDYPVENIQRIQKELVHQHNIGLLPDKKSQTDIFLHIDKNAPWNSVAKLLFGIREIGFDARPIFTTDENQKQ